MSIPEPNRPLYGQRRDGRAFRTSGLTPKPVHQLPYRKGLLTSSILPAPVDKDGIRSFELDGKSYYHPVGIAQYALAKLDVAQRTGNKAALRAAKINAAKLIDISRTAHGGMYFPYRFDFALGGFKKETIHAPWWSGMVQGQALSLFVRLYEETGKESLASGRRQDLCDARRPGAACRTVDGVCRPQPLPVVRGVRR